MKRGKQTCRILKDIRRQIAEANDIEFITSECQYQGDCLGTCPKCEAEVRYLEQQLERKRMAGKAITILGISAGLVAMAPMTSCSSSPCRQRQHRLQHGSRQTDMPSHSFQNRDIRSYSPWSRRPELRLRSCDSRQYHNSCISRLPYRRYLYILQMQPSSQRNQPQRP